MKYSERNLKSDYYPRSEKFIILAIVVSIAFPMVDAVINRVFQIEFWDSFVTNGIYYGALIIGTYFALLRSRVEMFKFPILFLIVWLISYLFFPQNRPFLINVIMPILITSMPLFILVITSRDYSRLYNALRWTSIIVVIASMINLNLKYLGTVEQIEYMTFSYNISLSVMFLVLLSIRHKRAKDIMFAILGFFIIVVSGSRGALFGIIFGTVFYIFIGTRFTIKKMALIFPIIVFFTVISTNFKLWIALLNNSLRLINFESRTISLLLTNEIDKSDGRDLIYEDSFIYIQNNWFTGYGMTGDRVLLNSYPHNIFIELLLQYGLIFGLFFILAIIYYLLRPLFNRNKDELYCVFFAAFFSTGFMKLIFSSSYLLEPTFFLMIAFCLLINKKKPRLNYLKH